MAIDKDIKLKIRAKYESSDISAKKVAEEFRADGVDVSEKTVQAWIRKEGWVKGRFGSLAEAIEELLPKEVLESVGEEVKKRIIDSMAGKEVVSGEVIDKYAEAVSKEVIWQQLSRNSLLGKLGQNLQRAENNVSITPSMGNVATYHGMLISTIQTMYGKKVDISIDNPALQGLGDEELKNKSTDELIEIIEREEGS